MTEKRNENDIVLESTAERKTAKKPPYKRRWVQVTVVLILLAYFCLVPSRLKMTPETTGLADPVMRNGKVDYFAAYERMYLDKLSPPEDNGFRLMLAACGPRIIEQTYLVDTIPWEEIPTNKDGGEDFFKNRWMPLCEHLYIDPYRRPPFLDKRAFFWHIRKLKEEKKAALAEGEEFEDDNLDFEKLWEQLVAAPWKAEDFPEVANWLEEYSPVLDYFNICVRKPNYIMWRQKSNSMIAILLPDIQASRDFVRNLRIRINHLIAAGQTEAAWEDIMSIIIFSRKHLKVEPFFVNCLVGISCENEAFEAIRVLLKFGNPDAALLEKMAEDLNSFPGGSALSNILEWERYLMLDALSEKGYLITESFRNEHLNILYRLPIDMNIAGKRMNELFGYLGDNYTEDRMIMGSNPALRKNFRSRLYEKEIEIREKSTLGNYLRTPLIRTRSKLFAELLFLEMFPGLDGALQVYDVADARYELLRIGIAVERYRLEHGEYPADLERLVPKYLDSVPLDPCTARATMSYRVTPQDDSPYMIYSFGRNEADNAGRQENPETKNHPDGRFRDDDIVFKL